MTLRELIDNLKICPKGTIFSKGFHSAHSYRGNYYELAVEPTENVTVEEMINTLEEALDKTFEGYKGGDFLMHGGVEVYLAYTSYTGQPIMGWAARVDEGFVLLTGEE